MEIIREKKKIQLDFVAYRIKFGNCLHHLTTDNFKKKKKKKLMKKIKFFFFGFSYVI